MMTVADIFECVEHELLSNFYPQDRGLLAFLPLIWNFTVGFWPFTLSSNQPHTYVFKDECDDPLSGVYHSS